MFKLSLEWLNELSEIKISEKEFVEGMYRQGFEIAGIEEVNDDKIIEIEVKANRSDILSHQGVLREVYGLKNRYPCRKLVSKLRREEFSFDDGMRVKIMIHSDSVHRYAAIEIYAIDNTQNTPSIIKTRLEKLGVKSINPVVDISNYIMLMCGQPIHIYDIDKIKNQALKIAEAESELHFTTLNATESVFPEGTVIISDEDRILCIGGIIGGPEAEVDSHTKNILIEAANFDPVKIRIASKKSHVTTAASYRFERGVDILQCFEAAMLCAEEIRDICGGNIAACAFDYCREEKKEEKILVSLERINGILGTSLSSGEMIRLLKSTFFEAEETDGKLSVRIPSFRPDVKLDADIAEEVARMYGYHNIEAKLPELNVPIVPNLLRINADLLREILVGYGFMECLTYSFIPLNALEMLNIIKGSGCFGDVILQNPLSNQYALMRPTMAYSMLDTIINNVAKSKNDLKIFEIGKTYFKDSSVDTGYSQKEVIAVAFTGNRLSRGFGNNQDLKYGIYDMLDLLACIMSEFNLAYTLEKCSSKASGQQERQPAAFTGCGTVTGFYDKELSARIIVNRQVVGCIGRISRSVLDNFENGKLVKNDVLFMEFEYHSFVQTKKTIQYQSDYPGMKREYNLLCGREIEFETLKKDILRLSSHIIKVQAKDVYQGKGVPEDKVALLISIEYNAKTGTLNSSEVEEIEKLMLKHLEEKYGIVLK